MHPKRFLLHYHLIALILSFHAVLASICPGTPSCNCTLTNSTDLAITCQATPLLTQLPTLVPSTLQRTVTHLQVMGAASKGPLIRLPTNICSYTILTILDLSSNSIGGLVNTSDLLCLSSTLTYLDLSSNNISTVDMSFLKTTRVLQFINLAQNSLTVMPLVDAATFVRFPTSLTSINVSFNQITSVDLWPLFVKTRRVMTIDLSHNLIQNYTNKIPVSVRQLIETPDPRYFYLNDNRLTHISDLLLEQYDACGIENSLSTAYFVVGISNLLVTENPLVCDCQSYQLVTYINDNLNSFPEIFNRSALLTQATCSGPPEQNYIFQTFDNLDNCATYQLPNISDIFCSLDENDTRVTLAPPTYWTTVATTNVYPTDEHTASSDRSSTSVPWYIIVAIILALLLVLALILVLSYICRHRLCPKKFSSKRRNLIRATGNNLSDANYRRRMNSSQTNLRLHDNGRTPTDDQGGDLPTGSKPPRGGRFVPNGTHPEQETQTHFAPTRIRPTGSRGQDPLNTSHREGKPPLPPAVDIGIGTGNGVKGIPIAALPIKGSPTDSNTTDTTVSEVNVKAIPLGSSKRAKLLPQIKGGNPVDSIDENLLNTSAGALLTSQRQRRRSLFSTQKEHQNAQPSLPPRPQSMVAKRTNFDHGTDEGSIPTFEGLKNKPAKPLRAVPLLSISAVPAWVDPT